MSLLWVVQRWTLELVCAQAGVPLDPSGSEAKGLGVGPGPLCVAWLYVSLSAIGATWRGLARPRLAQISLWRLGPALPCVRLS